MELLGIVVKIIGALLGGATIWVLKNLNSWIVAKYGEKEASNINSLIQAFVESAEQTLKQTDPTGEKRKQYVVANLKTLGVKVTEEVNAYIESAVYKLK